jgi:hypothetical protein
MPVYCCLELAATVSLAMKGVFGNSLETKLSMMKPISILVLIFTCAIFTPAQENKCTLKLTQLKQAPELYGLRIGMTLDQVKVVVPSLQSGPADDLGFATTSFSPDFNPQMDKVLYAGVRTVSLEFLDGKLFLLWIGFNKTYKWKTLDEFVPGMGAALGLPAGAWPVNSPKPTVDCEDFGITAAMIAGAPSIRLEDTSTREVWNQRRTAKEEMKTEQEAGEPK